MADKVFNHVVEDADDFVIPFDIEATLPARIRMDWSDSDGFWLSANREGYEHLARVFAEMALRDFGEGTHWHVDQDFRMSGGPPEFSFELDPQLAVRLPVEIAT